MQSLVIFVSYSLPLSSYDLMTKVVAYVVQY